MANKMTVLGVMFFDNHISPGYYFSYGTPIFLSQILYVIPY